MSKFEILCVTMHQNDFSKIKEMNIRSDVVFANQADRTELQEIEFEGHKAKMISTDTRGVGTNRNFALMYANADICLMADDDVVYADDMESRVVAEFERHPNADIIIFHFETDDPVRKQVKYSKTKKCGPLTRMPWGGYRIAFRLNSVRKANVWFTTLFGGGCIFPSGEDSMWLREAKRKGLTFYVSKETIGKVSFAHSTWFTGYDEKFYYGKGAYYQAMYPRWIYVWMMYFLWRTRKHRELSCGEKMKWMRWGWKGYKQMQTYNEWKGQQEKKE